MLRTAKSVTRQRAPSFVRELWGCARLDRAIQYSRSVFTGSPVEPDDDSEVWPAGNGVEEATRFTIPTGRPHVPGDTAIPGNPWGFKGLETSVDAARQIAARLSASEGIAWNAQINS
jgi:hypothetical protein